MWARLAVAAVVFAVAVNIGGCNTQEPPTITPELTEPSAMDLKRSDMHGLAGLFDALEREGLAVSESTSAADPGVFGQDATYYAFSVDDGVVRVYLTDTPAEASELASRISKDGFRYRASDGGDVNVSWIGRPRYFEAYNVIALYLEEQQQPKVSAATDEKVMRALTSHMGEPFAGAP